MNKEKLKTNIKRFFSNPNTITFLLIIVLIIIVYFVYSYLVNKAIAPVIVPYAATDISAKTEITADQIETAKITGNFVAASGNNLYQTQRTLLHKYVAPGYQIPKYSFFYKDAVTDSEMANETSYTNLPDDYTIFKLNTNFNQTYGNSIMPGNYIDLYFQYDDKDAEAQVGHPQKIYTLFIKSIQVLSVKDEKGKDVFLETDKNATEINPKTIEFAVPIQLFQLLRQAELIGATLVPVPRNAGYSDKPSNTEIANDAIQNLILSKAIDVGSLD